MSELNFREKTTILVDFFIKKEQVKNWTQTDWNRELAGAKRLFNKYPDFEFFYSLQDLYSKFNSLLGISDKYVKGLTRRYEDFVIDKEKHREFKMEEKAVINIGEVKPRVRNLFEFLDN